MREVITMRISRENIDHNTVRLIKERLECLWEILGEGLDDHHRIATLAEINGIIAMADVMKEVLKA